MNKLASIEKIISVNTHPNADRLELAQVLGYQTVIKKGEFKPGDLCVFVFSDTVLPPKPEFDFLKDKNYRIKICRLRGAISEGICFPLSILTSVDYNEGREVSEELGIIHYEAPLPVQLAGQTEGKFPHFLIKTDELNLRTYPDALNEFIGQEVIICAKWDGSSGTFFFKKPALDIVEREGVFGVCSRNLRIKESETNAYWQIARKYNIEEKLRSLDKDLCIQGEIVGPGIQKNTARLSEVELRVFDIYDIENQQYLGHDETVDLCAKLELPTVNVIYRGEFNYTLSELIEMANKGTYGPNLPCEGIVIRTVNPIFSQVLRKRLSVKVLSEKYGLRHE